MRVVGVIHDPTVARRIVDHRSPVAPRARSSAAMVRARACRSPYDQ
jgi:hypothetical protein